jgi:hypothetical protein
VFVEAFECVGAIRRGLFFGGGAERVIVELAKVCVEFVDAFEGASVAAFPVSGLLSEFEIFALEPIDL